MASEDRSATPHWDEAARQEHLAYRDRLKARVLRRESRVAKLIATDETARLRRELERAHDLLYQARFAHQDAIRAGKDAETLANLARETRYHAAVLALREAQVELSRCEDTLAAKEDEDVSGDEKE